MYWFGVDLTLFPFCVCNSGLDHPIDSISHRIADFVDLGSDNTAEKSINSWQVTLTQNKNELKKEWRTRGPTRISQTCVCAAPVTQAVGQLRRIVESLSY